MGPLLVLVSPCFQGNCSCHMQNWVCFVYLRYFTSEKRNCFLFWKSNFKKALIWKKGYFDLLFTFFSYQGKVTKIPSAHISLTYIHTCVLLAPLTFLPYQFWKKKYEFIRYGFSLVWFLCWFLFAPFWNNL